MQTSQVEGPIESPTNPDFPPACNWLRVNSFYGLSPSWRHGLGVMTVTPGQKAKPAKGTPGEDNYVAAVDATEDARDFRELWNGNGAMTQEQWTNWTDQATDPYVLECAAGNLGLTLAPTAAKKPATAKKTARTAAPAVTRSKKKRARR